MAMEIERKYLIKEIPGKMPWQQDPIVLPSVLRQGYLHNSDSTVVRVRIADDTGFLTIKSGISHILRREFEYKIPLTDAVEMLALCPTPPIEKRRYHIEHMGFTWEIDVFSGVNEGLVVAEIELNAPDQHFEKPPWLGREVTHDPRYYNSNLVLHPFCNW